jgi:cysteinyl-tRNA synthetase
MSKSLGNFFTIREIFEKSGYSQKMTAEVLRYFLLSTHYRSPIDFSDQSLSLAKSALNNFYILFQKLEECKGKSGKGDAPLAKDLKAFPAAFEKAMDDDFNTAGAMAQLQKLRNQVNRAFSKGLWKKSASAAKKTFLTYGKILGLFQIRSTEWRTVKGKAQVTLTLQAEATGQVILGDETIANRVAERNEARRRKDWARSDAIRKQLADAGITLEDRPDGTTRVRR